MYNDKDLIKVLNGKTFMEAAEEAYYFLTADMTGEKININTFVSYLKAWFLKSFTEADNDGEKAMIFDAAKKGDVYLADIDDIIGAEEESNAQIGERVHKNCIDRINSYKKYYEDPKYDELSELDKKIVKYIKEEFEYVTINELKSGRRNIKGYRPSKEEIKLIEWVKMTAPINKQIHLQYDVKGSFGIYRCKYDEIPDDDILKTFAFHTNADNPEIEVIFEDGTIVDYRTGDLRVKSYSFKNVVTFTKLTMIEQYELIANTEYGLVEFKHFDDELLRRAIKLVRPNVYCNLESLEEVYTKTMIEESKKETNTLKQYVKKYNL